MEEIDHQRYVSPYQQVLIHGLKCAKVPPTEISKITGYSLRTIYNKINDDFESPIKQKRGRVRIPRDSRIIDFSYNNRGIGARKISNI